ncbi:hypothetical protein [Citrobacter sp. S-77]|uniref:hypothetical protein n=1 Tax=Citrobacter sp. S-77 TaxID=1080067 RepID=UPI0005F0AC15|nr:hypothetical protein [Citrobacter sp. S-77]
MWVLIFWMLSPHSLSLIGESQPTLQVQTQEFNSEGACKDAFAAIKKLNDGDFKLRGVRVPKD